MNRKLCSSTSGRRASARDRRRNSGQIYDAVTNPQAMKLKAIPVPYRASCGIVDLVASVCSKADNQLVQCISMTER